MRSIHAIIDRELNELKYKNVSDWFAYSQKLVSSCVTPIDGVWLIAEAKATRDLIVHNGGVVNEIYKRKAGTFARSNIGKSINITGDYIFRCWQLFSRVLISIINEFRLTLVSKRDNA